MIHNYKFEPLSVTIFVYCIAYTYVIYVGVATK